ncbi:MAG TPA: hypothetical protein VFV95_19210 [Vicinamibacterales bacterium]|nr:hypothetical protein [Vicinamibacterales bacterium]
MRGVMAVAGLCCAWSVLLGGQTQAPPVFRADVDTVAVNVSVKRGNNPVSGLTPHDFRLYDNDVRQRVAAVSQDAVPVDISFVIDLSPSVGDLETLREAVRRMTGLLRSTDRFRILTMGNSVVNAVPWQPAGPPDTSVVQSALGHISLVVDSALLALLHRSDPDRRHLVVAFTDGQDICSVATGDTLRRVAERSDAVFHWINIDPGRWNPLRGTGVESICRNYTHSPIDMSRFFTDATKLTGGSVRATTSSATMTSVFDAILDDFRRSYILHFVPEGVSREGWHRLRVELPERQGYTVRTRPGYWGTAAVPAVR